MALRQRHSCRRCLREWQSCLRCPRGGCRSLTCRRARPNPRYPPPPRCCRHCSHPHCSLRLAPWKRCPSMEGVHHRTLPRRNSHLQRAGLPPQRRWCSRCGSGASEESWGMSSAWFPVGGYRKLPNCSHESQLTIENVAHCVWQAHIFAGAGADRRRSRPARIARRRGVSPPGRARRSSVDFVGASGATALATYVCLVSQ
jgi:hypothetical protein